MPNVSVGACRSTGPHRNANTARQELERLAGESALGQGIDPLHVLEAITAYFYGIAEATQKMPDATLSQIASFYEKAGKFAALAVPYRHQHTWHDQIVELKAPSSRSAMAALSVFSCANSRRVARGLMTRHKTL